MTIADTQQTEYSVPENNTFGETPLLNIKIHRHSSEHFQFIATGGKIHSHQLSHKRTLVVVALLTAGGHTIAPSTFCKLLYGKVGNHPSARFGDSIINVGLRPYRTDKPPYRFPQVTFDWTDISEDELKTYLIETARK